MGWNSYSKVLSSNGGYTKIAGNGAGDLQKALKSSRTKQVELFAYGDINRFAIYKAFKSAAADFASIADRNTARANDLYGFGFPRPTFSPQASTPSAGWSYTRPSVPSYPLRSDDFVYGGDSTLGYQQNAAPCFAVTVGQIVKTGQSQINLWLDNMYNYSGVEQQGRVWSSGTSMSFSDFMSGYSGYYFAFLIISGSTKNVVVSKYKVSDVLSNNGFQTVELYVAGNGSSNPSIPVIDNTSTGGSITIIAYLYGTAPSSGKNYEVITNVTASQEGYSLAFESGLDTVTTNVLSGQLSLVGTTVEWGTVGFVNMYDPVTDSSGTWDKFRFNSIYAVFDTTGATSWSPSSLAISMAGQLVVNAGSMKVGETFATADSTMTVGTSDDLYSDTSGQTRQLSTSVYVWILRVPGQTLSHTISLDYNMIENGQSIGRPTNPQTKQVTITV